MASTPEPILDNAEQLIRAYEANLAAGCDRSGYVETLLIRDRLHLLVLRQKLSTDETRRICKADMLLKAQASKVGHTAEIEKLSFRHTILPGKEHWWWRPREEPLLWNIISLLMLVITAALATDFCARILSRNPDAWGISAVLLQGGLAVLAGGTFTSTGKKILGRIGVSHIASRVRASLAMVLALTVLALWYFVPTALANHYNRLGLEACPLNLPCSHLPIAITMFERASSLDPADSTVHYNFGRVYELAYDYERAIQQYQEAVRTDESPGALNNWARLLLIQKKDTVLALTLLDDAMSQAKKLWEGGDHRIVAASIYKNRGRANYQAGYYSMAEADLACSLKLQRELTQRKPASEFCDVINGMNSELQPELTEENSSDSAAQHCLLAMVESSLKNPEQAQIHAKQCVDLADRQSPAQAGSAPKVDADSIRFSQDLLTEMGQLRRK